jgi:hypothetical protein
MPELAEMHEETAATLRMLMAERNRLREAMKKIARADFNCTARQMGMAMQGCAEDVLKELVT